MHLWLHTTLTAFERDNGPLVTPTRSLLQAVIPDDATHGQFINTLSLLEHMGSHKIMSTQTSSAIDQRTLRHVAEEAHHAYFMKRQAEKAANRSLQYADGDLLAPASARMYFQRLEVGMKHTLKAVGAPAVVYLYMSMIIEFRALWFYALYQRALQDHGHSMSLKRVLGEEQHHLSEMVEQLEELDALDETYTTELLARERRLYQRLLGAMHRAVSEQAQAA